MRKITRIELEKWKQQNETERVEYNVSQKKQVLDTQQQNNEWERKKNRQKDSDGQMRRRGRE